MDSVDSLDQVKGRSVGGILLPVRILALRLLSVVDMGLCRMATRGYQGNSPSLAPYIEADSEVNC